MILIVSILLALCSAASQAQQSASERMAARLQQLACEVRAQVPTNLNTLNMNAASAAYLREQLAKAQNHNRQQALRLELAIQLLRAGQTREAIAELHILQAQDLSPSLRTRTRDRLGIAYLRLGEQENCLLNHTIASCLLPIQGEGIHTLQEGSQAAIEQYTAVLSEDPDDLSAHWLLNIAYMTLGQYPHAVPPEWLVPPDCFADSSTIGRFADRAPGLGLDVVALSGGSIVDDFDNDGYLDVVASSWGLDDQLRYFRQPRRRHLCRAHRASRPHRPNRRPQHLPSRLRQRRQPRHPRAARSLARRLGPPPQLPAAQQRQHLRRCNRSSRFARLSPHPLGGLERTTTTMATSTSTSAMSPTPGSGTPANSTRIKATAPSPMSLPS